MEEHDPTAADGDANALEDAERPETARTLANWEPTPRVITEEEDELFDSVTVSPSAPAYLRAYTKTGNSVAACSIVGISPSTPRAWKRRDPHFAAIRTDIKEEVVERWNAVCEYRAGKGFEERIYDGDGKLIARKVRQDPSFLRAMMGAQDPENWGTRGDRESNITVVIVDVAE